MLGPVFVLTIALVWISAFVQRHWSRNRRGTKYPPGPIGVPGLGSLYLLRPNPSEVYEKLSQQYGPIFSLQLGWTEWVVINNFELARQGLSKHGDKLSGRPEVKIFSELAHGNGIGFVDYGSKWKSQRKFGLATLTGFGLGKTSLEIQIHDEVDFLLKAIHKHNGKAFDCQDLLTNAVSNIICRIVMGSRYPYDDERFQNIISRLKTSFSGNMDARLLAIMTLVPTLRFFPGFYGAYKRQFEDLYAIFDILKEIVHEHQKTFDANNIRDFIDAFLNEMDKNKEGNTYFTEEQLLHYVRDLFIAGTDTTSNSLRWSILSLLRFPHCQERIQKEIDSVIGKTEPRMVHMNEMPYTRAWILEVMRHRTVFPLMAPRKTTANISLGGYEIPKDTPVMVNLWSIHNNPTQFKNPEKFLPERFLDEDGNYVPHDHVIPFAVGPRNCMGAQLVKMEIFIFLTSIMQNFSVTQDPDSPMPDFDSGVFGFTYVPHQFNTIFKPR